MVISWLLVNCIVLFIIRFVEKNNVQVSQAMQVAHHHQSQKHVFYRMLEKIRVRKKNVKVDAVRLTDTDTFECRGGRASWMLYAGLIASRPCMVYRVVVIVLSSV